MTRRTAQKPAKHIAAPFIGGHYAVADHHGGAADMVGDHAQRNVDLFVFVIFHPGNAHDVFHDILHGIDFKQVVDVLRDARKTFKAHAGVDIGVGKTGVVVVPVVFKLGEHQVPKFDIAVAVAADFAVRLAAAVFFAAVIINFRAGTARTRAVLPEVVLFAEADHMVGVHADGFGPNVIRFVIVFINADIKLFRVHFHDLRAEFPRPRDNLFFEIVAEREVAEHFKISAVARGFADVFNVGRADALLAGGYALSRRRNFAGEIFFHGRHTGVNQQKTFVVLGNQRKAGKPQVPLAFKKLQIHFP